VLCADGDKHQMRKEGSDDEDDEDDNDDSDDSEEMYVCGTCWCCFLSLHMILSMSYNWYHNT